MKLGWRFLASERDPAGEPDWVAARPREIDRALELALAKPTGGWYALDASRRIGRRPRVFEVAGGRWVAWRDRGALRVAPEACPHLGASLGFARVRDGALVCPWHGLALDARGHGAWRCLPAHDDGVLAWVRLDGPGESPSEAPVLPPRPRRAIAGVVRVEARCEPRDVLANRLDPWHGRHFHPYAFAALEVLERSDEELVLRVEKRVLGPLRVAVEASFRCPDARTIAMTIRRGEGAGSVVETHATPLADGRTAIVEANLATSARAGFRAARLFTPWMRLLVERSARRLWRDDAAYAERLYELRASRQGASSTTCFDSPAASSIASQLSTSPLSSSPRP